MSDLFHVSHRQRRWILRFSHLALVALCIWVHVVMAMSPARSPVALDGRKALSFAWDVLVQHPQLGWRVGGPLLVVAMLLGLLFVGIARLARMPDVTPLPRALAVLLLSWVSCFWLLLHVHALLFPHSGWNWPLEPLFTQAATPLVDVVATGFLLARLARMLIGARSLRTRYAMAGVAGVVLLGCGATLASQLSRDAEVAPHTTGAAAAPNVVMIGLDSLRRDVLLSASAKDFPHLAALRDRSFVEANVVTPLARTFPAWTTILTGMGPKEHGARDNLAPQELVRRDASLGWFMKARGYRTVYATDETRFSNIGREFGFDQVVGPMPGVPDFVLSQFADSPLVNLSMLVPYAEYVFPSLVGNRAFAQAYRPQRFIDRLETALGSARGQPHFLAIHLCLAHWPFYSAQSGSINKDGDPYFRSAQELDTQFGALMQMLRDRGWLDDSTLLVVLADHGEALTSDWVKNRDVTRIGTDQQPGVLAKVGHGNTLLVPVQWQVFTMFSGQSVLGPIPGGTSTQLASLQDVAPSLKALLGTEPTSARMAVVDAVAELPESRMPRRYVAIETGFRPRGFDETNPDGDAALGIASRTFDIMDNGRLEMKVESFRAVIADKDFGVTDGENILARVRDEGGPLLVSALPDGSWHVYPADEKPTGAPRPPLLDEACEDGEMAPLLASWCGVHMAEAAR